MKGEITIGEATLSIVSANLNADVHEGGSDWRIDIRAEELDLDLAKFSPDLYAQSIPELENRRFQSLEEVFEVPIQRGLFSFIYFTAHIELSDSHLEFSSPKTGRASFRWGATADLNWGDGFGRNVGIFAEGEVEIGRISFYQILEESKARASLRELIGDSSEFEWRQSEVESVFTLKS